MRTITTAKGGEFALCVPHIMTMRNAGKPFEAADQPMHTVTANGAHKMLVAAFLAKHYGGNYQGAGVPMDGPVSTVTTIDHHALVAANLVNFRGTSPAHLDASASAMTDPLHTVSAGGTHAALVAAFLTKYYGNDQHGQGCDEPLHTVPTRDRFGLVTVTIAGEPYYIADIGMRMLSPRELARAQGFPDSYQLAVEVNGKPMSKSSQIARIGNSVCPPVAAAIIRANLPITAEAAPSAAMPGLPKEGLAA